MFCYNCCAVVLENTNSYIWNILQVTYGDDTKVKRYYCEECSCWYDWDEEHGIVDCQDWKK